MPAPTMQAIVKAEPKPGAEYQRVAVPEIGALDISPLISDRIPLSDFQHGMELLLSGNACKVLMYPNGLP
ncbi:MAG TPA: hypothetical protein VM182_07200 [Terriglobia bacterium]|nr:hypothetical protein [Terriglobia bacterium]